MNPIVYLGLYFALGMLFHMFVCKYADDAAKDDRGFRYDWNNVKHRTEFIILDTLFWPLMILLGIYIAISHRKKIMENVRKKREKRQREQDGRDS